MFHPEREGNAPNSPSERRPGDRPFFVDPNCTTCGLPLVYSDILEANEAGIVLKPDQIWYDSFICPDHREEGVVLDWPEEMRREILDRDPAEADAVALADFRGQGGPVVMVPRELLESMKESDFPVEEMLEQFKHMLTPGAIPEPDGDDTQN